MLALQIPLPEPCLPEPFLPVAPAITPRTVRQDCVEPRSASGDKLDAYLEKRGRTLKCAKPCAIGTCSAGRWMVDRVRIVRDRNQARRQRDLLRTCHPSKSGEESVENNLYASMGLFCSHICVNR